MLYLYKKYLFFFLITISIFQSETIKSCEPTTSQNEEGSYPDLTRSSQVNTNEQKVYTCEEIFCCSQPSSSTQSKSTCMPSKNTCRCCCLCCEIFAGCLEIFQSNNRS